MWLESTEGVRLPCLFTPGRADVDAERRGTDDGLGRTDMCLGILMEDDPWGDWGLPWALDVDRGRNTIWTQV